MSCAGMSIGAGVGNCTGVRPSTGASMGGRDTGRLAATAGTGETDRADTVGATGAIPALLGDAAGDADTAGTVGAIHSATWAAHWCRSSNIGGAWRPSCAQ